MNNPIEQEVLAPPLFPKGFGWVASLFVVIVMVSIAVVYSTFVTRGKVSSLQDLEQERDDLQVQWSQLLLEQNSLGSYARVEQEATDKLKMFAPSANDIVMVKKAGIINKKAGFINRGMASN